MTKVIAHRGASFAAPENSMEAFQRAVDMGADGIELDIHSTMDGELIVRHDGVVRGRTMKRVSLVDVVAHVELPNRETPPVLGDVLDRFAGQIDMYIEIKTLDPQYDQLLLDTVAECPRPTGCQVHSFDHRIVKRLKEQKPELVTGALSSSYVLDPVKPLEDCNARALWQQHQHVDADLCDAVHASRRLVIAWTVDSPDHMEKLRAWGVDAVCTNQPDVARRVVG